MDRVVIGMEYGEANVELSEFDGDGFVIVCLGDGFRFSRQVRLDEDLGVANDPSGLATYFESLLQPWSTPEELRRWGGTWVGLELSSTSDGRGHVEIHWRIGRAGTKYELNRWTATVVTTLDLSTVERTARHLRAFFGA